MQPLITLNVQLVASFLALSIIGGVNSGYLYWKHRQKKPLMCPLDHDCSKVTESKWSHVFYLRNEILGMLFYTTMVISMLAIVLFSNLIPFIVLLLYIILSASALATLFSLVLIYIQLKKINDYCFYCIVNAVIILLIFLNSVLLIF